MIEIRQKKKHVDTQSCFETASYLQLIVLPMELVGISWVGVSDWHRGSRPIFD
jgi:hypothetical protein